ncbi:MAG TPA: universal stress protein [Pyrinomonadaceae bacterium]|jgi:nucleotide-binding universal stress UspA family protein
MIAYDGSAYADAALDDLRRAGLPREAEALIVSVGDGLVSVYSPLAEIAGTALTSRRVTSAAALAREQAVRLLAEARGFAAHARGRVLSYFPEWHVRTGVLEGSPSQELLRKAEEWGPDLLVVGSQGRSALGRFFLGSVSKSLATHARGPVRVGRRVAEKEDGEPVRLVVGVDGSNGARWAVFAVATRAWPAGTEVRLVVVDDGNTFTRRADARPRLEEMFTGGGEDPPINAHLMAEGARVVLADAGLNASVEVREGDPRRVLVDEARLWAADSIFVGSHGLGSLDGSAGLGGVASALVTDASCSVEVVRTGGPPGQAGGV